MNSQPHMYSTTILYHIRYVWFDALTNYLSGVHGDKPEHELSSFWPADAHIIGKDIIRFHSVRTSATP